MQMLLHFVLIPLKLVIIDLLNRYHRFKIWKDMEPATLVRGLPHRPDIQSQLNSLLKKRGEFVSNDGLVKINPDHQVIRHGSLAWATKSIDDARAAQKSIKEAKFKRGTKSHHPTPPGAAMSVAFAVAATGDLRTDEFKMAVNDLKKLRFVLQPYLPSDRLTWKSTGFDAIYTFAMLCAAGEKISFWYMLPRLPLMLRPITHWKNRNYHLDHFTMIGCYTIIKTSKSDLLTWFAERAMKDVWRSSRYSGNPYFAALMQECLILSEKDRVRVLTVHKNVHLERACRVSSFATSPTVYPWSWDNAFGDEFPFDDLKLSQFQPGKAYKMNYLRGITLGKSLLTLLR